MKIAPLFLALLLLITATVCSGHELKADHGAEAILIELENGADSKRSLELIKYYVNQLNTITQGGIPKPEQQKENAPFLKRKNIQALLGHIDAELEILNAGAEKQAKDNVKELTAYKATLQKLLGTDKQIRDALKQPTPNPLPTDTPQVANKLGKELETQIAKKLETMKELLVKEKFLEILKEEFRVLPPPPEAQYPEFSAKVQKEAPEYIKLINSLLENRSNWIQVDDTHLVLFRKKGGNNIEYNRLDLFSEKGKWFCTTIYDSVEFEAASFNGQPLK